MVYNLEGEQGKESSFAEIELTQNCVAVVDAEDFAALSEYTWFAVNNQRGVIYAARKSRRLDGTRFNLYMHNTLLVSQDGYTIDHIDGDGLNNRKSNLRLATVSQQSMNTRTRQDTLAQMKGVSFNLQTREWMARIQANGERLYLGSFDSAELAKVAYDAAAEELHGEFVRKEGQT